MGIVILILLCLISNVASAANTYDYLQLVLQWPNTYCINQQCISNLPLDFTIHGLWPSNFSGQNNPCVGTPFNRAQMSANYRLQTILLPSSWRSYLIAVSNTNFWQTEYNKHGTCSELNLPQTEYFTTTHWLWMVNNIYSIFSSSVDIQGYPILPGFIYDYTDLLAAVQLGIGGVTPVLTCMVTNNNQYVLHEVVICYDALGINRIHCVRQSSCSYAPNGRVLYP